MWRSGKIDTELERSDGKRRAQDKMRSEEKRTSEDW